jgi:hypothetical protein
MLMAAQLLRRFDRRVSRFFAVSLFENRRAFLARLRVGFSLVAPSSSLSRFFLAS